MLLATLAIVHLVLRQLHAPNPHVLFTSQATHSRQVVRVNSVAVDVQTAKCLTKQLQMWQQCGLVHSVRVHWFEGAEAAETMERPATRRWLWICCHCLPDKLTHRFFPRDIQTEAVFSVDVDTFFSCAALETIYHVWRSNSDDHRTSRAPA